MADSQSEAKRRAEARKAKILARGNSGLARLATTARGEEASKLFEATSTNPSRTTTPDIPPTTTSSSSIHQPHPTPFSRTTFEPTDRSSRGPSTPVYPDRERERERERAAGPTAGRRGFGFVDTPDSELDGFVGARAGAGSAGFGAGSPDEAYRRQLEGMMAMLGGGGVPAGSGAGAGMGGFGGPPSDMGMGMGGNPLAALLASMNGQGQAPGQAPGSSPLSLMDGPGGGNEDPMAAMLQAMSGAGGNPSNPFANFGPGGSGGLGGGGFPPGLFDGSLGAGAGPGGPGGAFPPGMEGLFPTSQPTKKSLIQRLYPFLHVMVITALWVFIVFLWEPALSRSQLGPSTTDRLTRSSWLGGMKGGLGKYGLLSARGEGLKGGFRDLTRDLARQAGFATLPVFWAFTTVEVLLQSTRFMLFKPTPSLPGMISNFLPLMPPHISGPILSVSRYATILNQVIKDGCLFLFLLGVGVIIGGGGASAAVSI